MFLVYFRAMSNPPPETASFQPQQIDFSNSETISLISSLLDSKLQKTFGDFKRSLDEREVETRRELKKLKTDSKAASSLQFKGNRIQFEFNTQLLDCLDLAISNLSEGNLLAVQEHLQKAKSDLEKRIKLIRFADKSPAGWAAVEEYESDELAENSEDEKKLRAAERRAFTKIKQKSSGKSRVSRFSNAAKFRDFQAVQVPGSSTSAVTSSPFSAHRSYFHQPFRAARHVQPSDICFNCNQRGHWSNSPACPLFYKTRASLPSTAASSTSTKSTTV